MLPVTPQCSLAPPMGAWSGESSMLLISTRSTLAWIFILCILVASCNEAILEQSEPACDDTIEDGDRVGLIDRTPLLPSWNRS